jgi:hypothetical protein
MPGNPGEKDRSLPSGVAPANDDDLLIPAQGGLHCGCSVLNTLTFKTVIVVHGGSTKNARSKGIGMREYRGLWQYDAVDLLSHFIEAPH